MYRKMQVTKKTTSLLVGCLLVLFLLLPPITGANAVDDCSNDKPQDCSMNRRLYETLVNSWCSQSSPGRLDPDDPESPFIRDVCKITAWTWTRSDSASLGFPNPDYCTNTPPEREADTKDYCFIVINKSSDFYTALSDLLTECGPADDQDAECARELKRDFLKTQKTDNIPWYRDSAPASNDKNFNPDLSPEQTPLMRRISTYFQWVSLGLGLIAVFFLTIAGIQYSASQDNPQAVAAAKTRIVNVVIGIVIYFLMYAAIQWLIPGGAF